MITPTDSGSDDVPQGMTLRAWLAGQALSALAQQHWPQSVIVRDAVKFADMTLNELQKETQP